MRDGEEKGRIEGTRNAKQYASIVNLMYNGIIVWEMQFTIHNNVLCSLANPKIMCS